MANHLKFRRDASSAEAPLEPHMSALLLAGICICSALFVGVFVYAAIRYCVEALRKRRPSNRKDAYSPLQSPPKECHGVNGIISQSSTFSTPSFPASRHRESTEDELWELTPSDIDPRRRGSLASEDSPFSSPGEEPFSEIPEVIGILHFSLRFSEEDKTLEISIFSITSILQKNGVRVDPYVKLTIMPTKCEVKTRIIKGARNPIFEETFSFHCEDASSVVLHFAICSFDRYSRDNILGEVTSSLSELKLQTGRETVVQCQILSRLTQISNRQPGELLVSLSYQPPTHRLSVAVLKARELPAVNHDSSSDTFVGLFLLYNGQVIAARATQVKPGNENPVYNEMFHFDLPLNENLNRMAVTMKVCSCSATTRSETLGWLEISAQAPSAQQYHWQLAAANPSKQVAQWHRLTSVVARVGSEWTKAG